jgi:hypothetical protein
MSQRLMISYSRSQTPFVNRFYQDLSNAGYSIWLDYRSIVPARPWLDQIHDGIDWADTLLLVISAESIASTHVLEEWEYALRKEKRVILVIFDAVDLSKHPKLSEEDLARNPQLRDADLAKLTNKLRGSEWVDFRHQYGKGLRQLIALMEGKEPEEKSAKKKILDWGRANPPETGFKASLTFWIAFLLSFLVVASSIATWWTIFIPYVLAPLPLQIYRRNYSLSRVLPALIFMPVFWFLTAAAFGNEGNILSSLGGDAAIGWLFLATLTSWSLLGLLLTPAIQRRARPEAARIHFASKPAPVDDQGSGSVPFTIEYSAEDVRYADELRRSLVRQGHIDAAKEDRTPEAVFVLISTYKKDTAYDPGQVAVYPILLQAVKDLAENLGRIQWIDFRRGLRHTDRLARLLRKPEELLKEVASAPTGAQEIFPLVVNALQYFYLLTGILGGGGILLYLASFTQLLVQQKVALDGEQAVNFLSLAVLGIVLFGAVLYSVRALRTRMGGSSAFYPLLILTIFQTVIQVSFIFFAGVFNEGEILYNTIDSVVLPAFAFAIGLLIVLPFLVFRRQELYRWLPTHTRPPSDKLERALLLYPPLQKGRLIYHVLFHACLIVGYILFVLSLLLKSPDAIYCLVAPFLLLVLGIRWLAWRSERKTITALAGKAG